MTVALCTEPKLIFSSNFPLDPGTGVVFSVRCRIVSLLRQFTHLFTNLVQRLQWSYREQSDYYCFPDTRNAVPDRTSEWGRSQYTVERWRGMSESISSRRLFNDFYYERQSIHPQCASFCGFSSRPTHSMSYPPMFVDSLTIMSENANHFS